VNDILILAKNNGFHVFNALTLLEAELLLVQLEDAEVGRGRG
jgi:hypothetical protein